MRRRVWPAWGVLVAFMIITAISTFYVKSDVDVQAKRQFIFGCNEIRARIAARLEAHEQILLSGAAFFDASDNVTRNEWRTFTQRLNTETNFPGIQGIGFALWIPPDRLAQHLREIRSECFPNYNIRPEGDRGAYSSIIYLEPFIGRNLRAFGYDMFSEPVRRAAMERARDQKEAALSGKVFLVQETDEDIQAGALMYVPVYRKGMPTGTVEERREALLGWVYSPYRMTDLMRGILGGYDSPEGLRIGLQVYDGTLLNPDTLLYDSQTSKDTGLAPKFTEELHVNFNGAFWILRFTQERGQVSLTKAWFILASGMIISLLLFWLTLSLYNSRFNALQMAERLTAELRASEERYRLVAETIHDCFWMATPDIDKMLYVSPAYETIWGRSCESLYNSPMSFIDAIHPDDRECFFEVIAENRSQGTRWIITYRIVRPDGSIRWVEDCGFPVYDAKGNLYLNTGIARDITERKQAERRQYVASEILGILNDTSTLTDSIKLILAVIKRETDVDAAGIRLRSGDDFPYFVQSGFSQAFLRTENTLISRDASGPCRDENGNIRLECACGMVLSGPADPLNPLFTEGGSIWTNDMRPFLDIPVEQDPRFHPRNNCVHQGYLSVALIPIRANREIVGLLQLNDRKQDCFTSELIRFFEGISASIGVALLSKRAEEELRISEDKFSKAFHMNPDAILITRLVDGMIVMVNEGFRQIFGATAEEVIGKTALELNIWVNPEDRNRVIEGVKTDGKVNNFEFIFRTRDGDIRYGLMSASIITLDGVAHILSITRDITERRLAQEQLFQAQKMEAVGTLAGGFAHDLNNKLQVIKGYVDLILFNKDVPETAKSNLGVIKHAVDTSAELIQGMMTFSRKTPVELQPIELNKLIASICSMLAHVIPKTIDIDLVAGDDLWTVNAAPNLIDQILMNLAINASDAMPDGGKLTIKTQNTTLDEEYCSFDPVAKPGRYVLIEVSDTGTGMDKETVSHIFEPFFTTKESGKGTGLGLAVVYGIVEKHGGRIVCDSEPSVGTTFRVYFPAIEDRPG